jgi:hypothetical protein
MLGQMAVGTLSLLLFAFWAIRRERDYLAGACLALATVKPQLAILIVPFFLTWNLLQQRWRVLLAFALALGILFGTSFLLFPSWLREFVRVVTHYPSYKSVQTGPGYLLSDSNGGLWLWVLEAVSVVWLLGAWWLARRGDARWLDGAFVLTLAMTSFLPPQTSIVNQLVLLPGILLLMRDSPNWAARLGLAVLSIAGSWIAFSVLYQRHYDLNMGLPPLVMVFAVGAWYLEKGWKHGRESALGPTQF